MASFKELACIFIINNKTRKKAALYQFADSKCIAHTFSHATCYGLCQGNIDNLLFNTEKSRPNYDLICIQALTSQRKSLFVLLLVLITSSKMDTMASSQASNKINET